MLRIFKRMGLGEVNQKRDRQREKNNLTNLFTLTHVHQNENGLQRYSFVHFFHLFAKNGH